MRVLQLRRTLLLGCAVSAINAGMATTALALCSGSNTGGNVDVSACSVGAVIGTSITGSLVNSGEIVTSITGIAVNGGVGGGVTNTGSIFAPVAAGIVIDGTVTGAVVNGGSISATNTGISVQGNVGSISNGGTIISGFEQGIVVTGSVTGGVTNTGSIAGSSTGIHIEHSVAGGVTNTGTITIGRPGVQGSIGIRIDGDVGDGTGGGIEYGGSISAPDAGISVSGNVAGSIVVDTGTTISNTGGYGLYLGSGIYSPTHGTGIVVNGTVGGGITNSGTITVQRTGIYSGDAIAGDVSNAGSISSNSANGIVVNGSVSGTVANTGTISTRSGNDIAIGGNVGGNVVNDGLLQVTVGNLLDATIGDGISIAGTVTGSLVNTSNGAIEAFRTGIFVHGDVGGFTNNGTITSAFFRGVEIDGNVTSGGVTNTGKIAGSTYGLLIKGSINGDLSNTGTITANGPTGVHVATIGGNLVNGNSISGSAIGIQIGGQTIGGTSNVGTITGGITNSGTITGGSQYGIYVDGNVGTDIEEDGGNVSGGEAGIFVAGNVGGSISLGTGIAISNTGGYGIDVVGSIGASAPVSGTGIFIAGTLGGGITNAGSIETGKTAIFVSGSLTGGLTNSGVISSAARAVSLDAGGAAVTDGDIVNAAGGTLSTSGQTAIAIGTLVSVGTVNNSGSIEATGIGGIGLDVEASNGTIATLGALVNSGTITAFSTAVVGAGSIGTIVNTGLISGFLGIHVETGGTIGAIVNTNTGTIAGVISAFETGIKVDGDVTGEVVNTGIIQSTGGVYYGIDIAGGVGGTVSNNGTITSAKSAIHIDGSVQGNVVNTGSLSSNSDGIFIGSGIGGSLGNGGTITAGRDGFQVVGDVTGSIVNIGLITAGSNGAGILVSGTVGGAVINGGAISGGTGIDLNVAAADVSNTGTITSGLNGIKATGILGTLSNSGLISTSITGGDAIQVADTLGGFYNDSTGSISAAATAINIGGTVTGEVSNAGAVTAAGNGIVLGGLQGSMTNSGTISAGNLGLYIVASAGSAVVNTGTGRIEGGAGAGAAAIALGSGSLNLTNSGTIIGDNNVALNFLGETAASTITQAGGRIQGGIYLSASQADIVDITGGTIAGAISGAAATVDFATTGTYTQNDSINVGAINLQSGTLVLAHDVTVASTFTNDATLEVDTQRTITGDYVQGSAGTLDVGVSTSGAGELTVTHDATFTGSTVDLIALGSGTLSAGETVTIVSAGDVADYSGVTVDILNPFLGLTGTTTVSGNDLLMVLSADDTVSAQDVADTDPNTQASAAFLQEAIQRLGANGTPMLAAINAFLSDHSSPLTMEQKVQLVARQLTPHTATMNADTTQQFTSGATTAVVQHIQTARAADNGAATGLAAGSDAENSAFWGQALAVQSRYDGNFSTAGDKVKTVGGAFGADTLVTPRLRLGGAFAYGNSVVDGLGVLGAGESSHIDSYQLSAYGSYNGGPWYVDGQLGLGLNTFDQSRPSVELSGQARAKYDSTNVMAHVDGGYDFQLGRTQLTPIAALTYTHQETDGYTERATLTDTVSSMSYDSVQTELGAQATWQIPLSDGRLVPTVKLGWLHDWIRSPLETTTTTDFGAAPTTFSDRPVADGIDLGLAATFYSLGDWQLQAQYDGNFYHDYASNAALVNLKVRF